MVMSVGFDNPKYLGQCVPPFLTEVAISPSQDVCDKIYKKIGIVCFTAFSLIPQLGTCQTKL
jgi:hypothetical protein